MKHARYYWLLLAEGHLTRGQFAAMLRRITLKHSRRANIWEVVGTEVLTLTQEPAVSEKSAGNDVEYAAKSRVARHRAVLCC